MNITSTDPNSTSAAGSKMTSDSDCVDQLKGLKKLLFLADKEIKFLDKIEAQLLSGAVFDVTDITNFMKINGKYLNVDIELTDNRFGSHRDIISAVLHHIQDRVEVEEVPTEFYLNIVSIMDGLHTRTRFGPENLNVDDLSSEDDSEGKDSSESSLEF